MKRVTTAPSEHRNVAVLMAVHNRRDLTVRALTRLAEIAPINWTLRYYVVDDGSTDGTAEAIHELDLDDITVIRGSGDWFWARSMAAAEAHVTGQVDDYLWVNDDVTLFDDALATFDTWRTTHPDCLLMGQFADPDTGEPSYTGSVSTGWYALSSASVCASSSAEVVDLAAANLLLVPSSASNEVGAIDGRYAHGHADYDYSLRAREAGYPTLAVPGFVGTARRNPEIRAASLRESLQFLNHRLGLTPRDRIRFLRRHGGATWPLQLPLPYIAAFLGRRTTVRVPNAGSSAEAKAHGH